jgi:hypothetical protein
MRLEQSDRGTIEVLSELLARKREAEFDLARRRIGTLLPRRRLPLCRMTIGHLAASWTRTKLGALTASTTRTC